MNYFRKFSLPCYCYYLDLLTGLVMSLQRLILLGLNQIVNAANKSVISIDQSEASVASIDQ